MPAVREIILDTETTGLDPRHDRIIEIGGVELVNKFPTGRTFASVHQPRQPQGSRGGTGRSTASATPTWPTSQVCRNRRFVSRIHRRSGHCRSQCGFRCRVHQRRVGTDRRRPIAPERIVDTLAIAKRKHPMGPNSLDALCRRYGIDNTHRTLHGALLDSELLAEVYYRADRRAPGRAWTGH